VGALADFTRRRHIGFPLLSDPDSEIIRRFGLLNPEYEPGNVAHGVPYPATFVVDRQGVVKQRYAEEGYPYRRTAASILTLQGADASRILGERRAKLFGLRLAASNAEVYPGQRITLVTELNLDEGLHAYAPGDHRYRALELVLRADPVVTLHETGCRRGLHFRLKETVRCSRAACSSDDVTLGDGRALRELLSLRTRWVGRLLQSVLEASASTGPSRSGAPAGAPSTTTACPETCAARRSRVEACLHQRGQGSSMRR
jgi:hypothetical protein